MEQLRSQAHRAGARSAPAASIRRALGRLGGIPSLRIGSFGQCSGILATICLISAATALADPGESTSVYRWTDEHGVVHFSDAPRHAEPETLPPLELGLDLELDLTEETFVPDTLNDLPLSRPATPATPLAAGIEAEPRDPAAPSDPAGVIDTTEAIDMTMDPDVNEAPKVYVDQFGEYTIGEPIDDFRIPPEVSCQAAIRNLALLADSWPVYHDQGGRLRFQWARDPYRGPRRYLDVDDRARATAAASQTARRDCREMADPEALAAARTGLLEEALCEAERTELAAMESRQTEVPGLTLADKRAIAERVCAAAGH